MRQVPVIGVLPTGPDNAITDIAGVRVGYTKQGLKPCHRPLVAALAEGQLIANFWLRRGDAAC